MDRGRRRRKVYPACAGIHLAKRLGYVVIEGLPRMRGDPPSPSLTSRCFLMSTPHARGSTLSTAGRFMRLVVYPACAGIHLAKRLGYVVIEGLPRMRGDPPSPSLTSRCFLMSTPHARGSTLSTAGRFMRLVVYPACAGIHLFFYLLSPFFYVYPACAGIHLALSTLYRQTGGLPRMRGDPPIKRVGEVCKSMSTPHARGSTVMN